MTPPHLPAWSHSARIYRFYAPGGCGAPSQLSGAQLAPRLEQLHGWIDHFVSLGINVLWLGPVFAASSHGYDTIDYYRVDPRLGDAHTLRTLVAALHQRGIRVVLDAVFNHVGRAFPAFRDVRAHRQHSAYARWFRRLNFNQRGRAGDPFSYQSWKGHHALVSLNHSYPPVRAHLLGAMQSWIEQFAIDGLVVDAADCISLNFLSRMASAARRLKPDFWLMGEVVHGDYRRWVTRGRLHAVTNYQLYHALHTAHNGHDYHRLADTLQHQFGPHGHYRDLQLYNFVDNHDVTRIASLLRQPAHLYPLHLLLFTLPGSPGIYYGSEWGQPGRKQRHSDAPLRPWMAHPWHWQPKAHPDLMPVITRLAGIHAHSSALQHGHWRLLQVSAHTLVFLRQSAHEALVVAVQLSQHTRHLEVHLPWGHGSLFDLLEERRFEIHHGRVWLDPLYPCWGRILRYQSH